MRRISLLSLLACLPLSAQAYDFDFEINPVTANQSDFRSVAEDMSATFNAKSLSPAESGSIAGFAVGVFASYVPTEDSAAWQRLIGEKVDEVGTVGLIVQKGLPFGIDLGASYAAVPGADARVFGAEVRVEVVEGDLITPAISLRGSYSELSGIDDLDYDSYGLDLSISKGFGPLTPYAGVGYVWSSFEADPQFNLRDENVDEAHLFIGLRLSALVGITPEYERVGDRNAFNLRFGFAF